MISEGLPDPDTLIQKIMDALARWQRVKAKEGSEKGGRSQKKIKKRNGA